MTNSFFDEVQLDGSYMNNEAFVSVVEHVYKMRRRHTCLTHAGATTGVPSFEVSSLLSGKKITSMPFNYYPPLTGAQSNETAAKHLISQARAEGGRCYAEYKSFERLPLAFCKEFGLTEIVYSIVSDLPLCDSHEAQRKLYKKRHRTKVNKARRELGGLDISISREPADLDAWYNLLLLLYRDKHQMICQPLSLYQALLKLTDHTTLLVARDHQRIVGGLFLMHDAKRWDYSWGAMQSGYDQRDLATLLLDHAIGLAIDAQAEIFSFGSSAPEDAALLFFKQRWGCSEFPIYAYYWNHAPQPIDLNNSFSLARKIISHTPLALLKAAPPLLVPYLT